MRKCAIRITYPAWADLVPQVAQVVDEYQSNTRLSNQGERRITRCFTLDILRAPSAREPLDLPGVAPRHLGKLEALLRERSIPFDVDHIDIDSYIRDTRTTSYMRRNSHFKLTNYHAFGAVPIWMISDPLGDMSNIIASCLLAADDVVASHELSIWQDLVDKIPEDEAAVLLQIATGNSRVTTHIAPLIACGLAVRLSEAAQGGAIEDAVSLNGDLAVLNRNQETVKHEYTQLLQRLGCGTAK